MQSNTASPVAVADATAHTASAQTTANSAATLTTSAPPPSPSSVSASTPAPAPPMSPRAAAHELSILQLPLPNFRDGCSLVLRKLHDRQKEGVHQLQELIAITRRAYAYNGNMRCFVREFLYSALDTLLRRHGTGEWSDWEDVNIVITSSIKLIIQHLQLTLKHQQHTQRVLTLPRLEQFPAGTFDPPQVTTMLTKALQQKNGNAMHQQQTQHLPVAEVRVASAAADTVTDAGTSVIQTTTGSNSTRSSSPLILSRAMTPSTSLLHSKSPAPHTQYTDFLPILHSLSPAVSATNNPLLHALDPVIFDCLDLLLDGSVSYYQEYGLSVPPPAVDSDLVESPEYLEWRQSVSVGQWVDVYQRSRWRPGFINNESNTHYEIIYETAPTHADGTGIRKEVIDKDELNIAPLFSHSRLALPQQQTWRYSLTEGSQLDALDTVQKWFTARVLSVHGDHILINYDGWTNKYDELLSIYSPRLALYRTKAVGGKETNGVPQSPADRLLDERFDVDPADGPDELDGSHWAVWRGKEWGSYFLMEAINCFSNHHGYTLLFHRILTRQTIPLPIPQLKRIISAVSHGAMLFTRPFALQVIPLFHFLSFASILDLSDIELRALSKEHLDDIVKSVDRLLVRLHSQRFTLAFHDEFTLACAVKRIRCSIVERRVNGMNYLQDYIAALKRYPMLTSASTSLLGPPMTSWLTPVQMLAYLDLHHVLDDCFSLTTGHHELMKRATDILKFLALENALENRHLNLIWKALLHAMKRDDDVTLTVLYKVLDDIAWQLSASHINYLFSLVESIPFAEYQLATLDLIKELTNLNTKTGSTATKHAMDLLWGCVTDEQHVSKHIAKAALNRIEEIIKTRSYRIEYLEQFGAMMQQQQHSLIVLCLIQTIIETFPDAATPLEDKTKHHIIVYLQENYAMIESFFLELMVFKKHSHAIIHSYQPPLTTHHINGLIISAHASYIAHIRERLNFLFFIYSHCTATSVSLTQAQMDILWAEMNLAAETPAEREALYIWLKNCVIHRYKHNLIIQEPLARHIFQELILPSLTVTPAAASTSNSASAAAVAPVPVSSRTGTTVTTAASTPSVGNTNPNSPSYAALSSTTTITSSTAASTLPVCSPSISVTHYAAFESYFYYVNFLARKVNGSGVEDIVVTSLDFSLYGLDTLWRIALECRKAEVSVKAISLLNALHENVTEELKNDMYIVVREKYIGNCFHHLQLYTTAGDWRRGIRCISLLRNLLDANEKKGMGKNRPHACQAKGRAIRLCIQNNIRHRNSTHKLNTMMTTTTPTHTGTTNTPTSNSSVLTATGKKERFEIISHANDTLFMLRDQIAALLQIPVDSFRLITNGKQLTSDQYPSLLHELSLKDQQTVLVTKRTQQQQRVDLLDVREEPTPLFRAALTHIFASFANGRDEQGSFFYYEDMASYILACGAPANSAAEDRIRQIFEKHGEKKPEVVTQTPQAQQTQTQTQTTAPSANNVQTQTQTQALESETAAEEEAPINPESPPDTNPIPQIDAVEQRSSSESSPDADQSLMSLIAAATCAATGGVAPSRPPADLFSPSLFDTWEVVLKDHEDVCIVDGVDLGDVWNRVQGFVSYFREVIEQHQASFSVDQLNAIKWSQLVDVVHQQMKISGHLAIWQSILHALVWFEDLQTLVQQHASRKATKATAEDGRGVNHSVGVPVSIAAGGDEMDLPTMQRESHSPELPKLVPCSNVITRKRVVPFALDTQGMGHGRRGAPTLSGILATTHLHSPRSADSCSSATLSNTSDSPSPLPPISPRLTGPYILRQQGFIDFYREACLDRVEAVWADLNTHGYRSDLKRDSSFYQSNDPNTLTNHHNQQQLEAQRETALPRNIIANNPHYIQLLFQILEQAEQQSRSRVSNEYLEELAANIWSLLQRLPTQPQLLHTLLSLTPPIDWNVMLHTQSLYRLLYSLQVADSLTEPLDDPSLTDAEKQQQLQARDVWSDHFLQQQGFHHLYSLFHTHPSLQIRIHTSHQEQAVVADEENGDEAPAVGGGADDGDDMMVDGDEDVASDLSSSSGSLDELNDDEIRLRKRTLGLVLKLLYQFILSAMKAQTPGWGKIARVRSQSEDVMNDRDREEEERWLARENEREEKEENDHTAQLPHNTPVFMNYIGPKTHHEVSPIRNEAKEKEEKAAGGNRMTSHNSPPAAAIGPAITNQSASHNASFTSASSSSSNSSSVVLEVQEVSVDDVEVSDDGDTADDGLVGLSFMSDQPLLGRQMSLSTSSTILSCIVPPAFLTRLWLHIYECCTRPSVQSDDLAVVEPALNTLINLLLFYPDQLLPLFYSTMLGTGSFFSILYCVSAQLRKLFAKAMYQLAQHTLHVEQNTHSHCPRDVLLQFLLHRFPSQTTHSPGQHLSSGMLYGPHQLECDEYFWLFSQLIRDQVQQTQQMQHVSNDGITASTTATAPRANDDQRTVTNKADVSLPKLLDSLSAKLLHYHSIEVEGNNQQEARQDKVLCGILSIIQMILTQQKHLRSYAGNLIVIDDGTRAIGHNLIPILFNDYLFGTQSLVPSTSSITVPKCKARPSRQLAISLLITLFLDTSDNLQLFFQQLCHQYTTLTHLSGFDYNPEKLVKSAVGYVGLRNLGSTCYMNSLLQQLFMMPKLRYGLWLANLESPFTRNLKLQQLQLQQQQQHHNTAQFHTAPTASDSDGTSAGAAAAGDNDKPLHTNHKDDGVGANGCHLEDDLLHQLQLMFAFLAQSNKQYYDTGGFCHSYKDERGQPINVRIQQDAQEFFNVVCDRLEKKLVTLSPALPQPLSSLSHLIQHTFGGTLLNQLLCHACSTIRESPEQFYSLSLQVKNKLTMSESLEQYVLGEVLTDFNCSTCHQRVEITKRVCLGVLADTMIFHLKRFELNYETFQHEKLNNRFIFPVEINLFPYTKEGLARKEREKRRAERQKKQEERQQRRQQQQQQPQQQQQQQEQKAGGESLEELETVEKESVVDISPDEDEYDGFEEDDEDEEEDVSPDLSMYEYQLVGILVHTGTASGGHYYSYIKERPFPPGSDDNESVASWMECNDHVIRPFDLKDLDDAAYGGEQEVTERTSWGTEVINTQEKVKNAYMLLYERIHTGSCDNAHSHPVAETAQKSTGMNGNPAPQNAAVDHNKADKPSVSSSTTRDAWVVPELFRLPLHSIIPPAMLHSVYRDNLQFQAERYIFNSDYFHLFISFLQATPEHFSPLPYPTQMFHRLDGLDLHAIDTLIAYAPEIHEQPLGGLKLLKLATIFAVDCLIRTADNRTFAVYQQQLMRLYHDHVPGCQWLLHYVSSHVTLITDMLLVCRDHHVRHGVMELLILALKRVSPFEHGDFNAQLPIEEPTTPVSLSVPSSAAASPAAANSATAGAAATSVPVSNPPTPAVRKTVSFSGIPASLCARYLTAHLSLWGEVPKHWMRFSQYFLSLLEFAQMGDPHRKLLIQRRLIYLTADLYLGDLSPVKRKRVQIGNMIAQANWTAALDLLSLLVRSCATDTSPSANGQCSPFTIPVDPYTPYYMTAEDEKMLKVNALYTLALAQNIAIPSVCTLAGHWCWENPSYSEGVIDLINAGLSKLDLHNAINDQPYYDMIVLLLGIDDGVRIRRYQRFLPTQKGFLSFLYHCRHTQPKRTYTGILLLLHLCVVCPSFATAWMSLRHEWLWMDSWLREHANRRRYSSNQHINNNNNSSSHNTSPTNGSSSVNSDGNTTTASPIAAVSILTANASDEERLDTLKRYEAVVLENGGQLDIMMSMQQPLQHSQQLQNAANAVMMNVNMAGMNINHTAGNTGGRRKLSGETGINGINTNTNTNSNMTNTSAANALTSNSQTNISGSSTVVANTQPADSTHVSFAATKQTSAQQTSAQPTAATHTSKTINKRNTVANTEANSSSNNKPGTNQNAVAEAPELLAQNDDSSTGELPRKNSKGVSSTEAAAVGKAKADKEDAVPVTTKPCRKKAVKAGASVNSSVATSTLVDRLGRHHHVPANRVEFDDRFNELDEGDIFVQSGEEEEDEEQQQQQQHQQQQPRLRATQQVGVEDGDDDNDDDHESAAPKAQQAATVVVSLAAGRQRDQAAYLDTTDEDDALMNPDDGAIVTAVDDEEDDLMDEDDHFSTQEMMGHILDCPSGVRKTTAAVVQPFQNPPIDAADIADTDAVVMATAALNVSRTSSSGRLPGPLPAVVTAAPLVLSTIKVWSCPRCTFENPPQSVVCDMCDCARPSLPRINRG